MAKVSKITEIREGKIFGAMEITSVKNDTIELRNTNPIDLTSGKVIHLMGNISIQVESPETGLVFYPFFHIVGVIFKFQN